MWQNTQPVNQTVPTEPMDGTNQTDIPPLKEFKRFTAASLHVTLWDDSDNNINNNNNSNNILVPLWVRLHSIYFKAVRLSDDDAECVREHHNVSSVISCHIVTEVTENIFKCIVTFHNLYLTNICNELNSIFLENYCNLGSLNYKHI